MLEKEKQEWTGRSSALRAELKKWEKSFASENNGQKASRDDIKKHPEIAAKYKEYNKVRDILSGKIVTQKEEPKHQTPRKRKHEEGRLGASKRQQVSQTPSRGSGALHPWEIDPYDSPSVVRSLFTPIKKQILGPTPQKDGKVLGLFDLLQENSSPFKIGNNKSNHIKPSLQATPHKTRQEDSLKPSSTPTSVGKRFMLDAFATPLKNRNLIDQRSKTPSSVSKLHFSTPSFLRRDNRLTQLPPVNENDEGLVSPQMVRVPRKPLVRGLSSMLAGLRKMEEEAADDDLDALHEMENEEAISTKLISNPQAVPPELLVADSQSKFILGGFDNEAQFDSEPEEPKDRDGQSLKVYRKKGQKRTTRRIKMKPTRSRPSAAESIPADLDSEDELGAPDLIPETQNVEETREFADSARNYDSGSQSEYTASEGGTRYRRPNQEKKRKIMGKDGRIRTAAKKVGAMAHTNFKRLKLRNSGAKGMVHGVKGRFRKRK